jgi:hypothetical protein
MTLVDPPTTLCVTRLRREATAISALYFGCPVYLVGGALTDPDPRDLDVAVIVPDALYVAAYGDDSDSVPQHGMALADWLCGRICGSNNSSYRDAPDAMWRRWARDCAKWNTRLTQVCHRRVDFKVQAASVAAMQHGDRPRARLDTTPDPLPRP